MQTTRCKVNSKCFCYVCGCYILGKPRKIMTNALKDAYLQYFGVAVVNTDKPWVPKLFCNACRIKLYKWSLGENTYFPFSVLTLWREQKNHIDDCYFCSINVISINAKKLTRYIYLDVSSVSKPVSRTDSDSSPIRSGTSAITTRKTSSSSHVSNGSDFIMEEKHSFSQSELSDLIRDLNLPKQKANLLASRL